MRGVGLAQIEGEILHRESAWRVDFKYVSAPEARGQLKIVCEVSGCDRGRRNRNYILRRVGRQYAVYRKVRVRVDFAGIRLPV